MGTLLIELRIQMCSEVAGAIVPLQLVFMGDEAEKRGSAEIEDSQIQLVLLVLLQEFVDGFLVGEGYAAIQIPAIRLTRPGLTAFRSEGGDALPYRGKAVGGCLEYLQLVVEIGLLQLVSSPIFTLYALELFGLPQLVIAHLLHHSSEVQQLPSLGLQLLLAHQRDFSKPPLLIQLN